MLNLSSKLTIDKAVLDSPNLCDKFSPEDLQEIGTHLFEGYERDVQSRSNWLRRTEAAMDLAMQLSKSKTFPWAGCSNVAFPLVTIAAMQFHARAYPAIVNGRSVVQCRVVGKDQGGLLKKRADLIGRHMSWQLLEQDESWEEGQDRALLNVAIVGCGFKKSFYNASVGHNNSTFVAAKDLVVNYWAKSVETANLKTHIIPLFKNDVHERVKRGAFRDCLNESWYTADPPQPNKDTQRDDARSGQTPPSTEDGETPFIILEAHCYMDLDGDGYAEPYIVSYEASSQFVLRIVTRFDRIEDIEYNTNNEIVRIEPTEYFTKIPFIPSPDGSIYDIGFGVLLGPLNESVNSAINQLYDAGTLSNTAGGFLGRGAKLKGGVYSFKPFDWQRVDATGDDLRKSIFPLPVREPSSVMFNLLTLIIEYTNRISGATDMTVGENPGQNTPAETSRVMLEQGQKIYSAIFKRIWRSMKQEFKKLFLLNAIYLPDRSPFGDGEEILREDYKLGGAAVCPVADPTITSDIARFARASLLREAAASNPGYNVDAVEAIYLQAMGVDNIEEVYPGQAAMPPPAEDVKVTIQRMKNEAIAAQLQQKQMEFVINLQETMRLNEAKIAQLMAQAQKLNAEAASEPAKRNVEAFRASIEAIREHNNNLNTQLDRAMEQLNESRTNGTSGGLLSVEGPSDNETVL
jgi:chaperonin GroES